MAYSEIAFEQLLVALETTRGTAITTPTHLLNLKGIITPKKPPYRPKESRGTLVKNYRAKVVKQWAEWQGDGDADPNVLPVLFNMAIKPNTSPTIPGGTTPRLWTFTRSISADDLKTGTLWSGDPNIQRFRAAFGTIDEIVLKNDASADDGVLMVTVKGHANFPSKVTVAAPAAIAGDVLPGQQMDVYLDTSSAIGTTAINNRVISVEHTIPTGIDPYKWLNAGASASFDYVGFGRKEFAAKTKITMEVPDMAQYDNWAAADTVKLRVRHSGAVIETTFHNYVEFDIYGPLDELEWGENGGNRTVTFMVESQYDTTLGADFSVKVQNARTAL